MSRNENTKLTLDGLHCAHCAAKIEKEVCAINGVKNARVDFVNQTLTIEAIKDELSELAKEAEKVILKIEPHVRVTNAEIKAEKIAKVDYKKLFSFTSFAIGCILFATAVFTNDGSTAKFWLYLAAYLLIGWEVLFLAVRNIVKGSVFDENFLMGIATVGAFAIGQYPEGVAVMLFYQIGEFFQDMAVNRSRRSISALMDIRPDFANLLIGDKSVRVAPQEVKINDTIIVKPGEKIPLDGTISSGKSTLDTSTLTGESMPRDVVTGDTVLSGSINKTGVLNIKVEKLFAESTVSKILDLVQNASAKKAPTENFITKFARYYTPFVVISAAALAFIPPFIIEGASFSEWLGRALVFLVVSCPCALVVSIPLSFFGGIGGASKNGILIKGSNFLEALNGVDTVVFDKTGTLTKGVFSVSSTTTANGYKEADLLSYAAHAEHYSNHPIANSVKKAHGKELSIQDIKEHEELSGYGVRALIDKKVVLVGNDKLMVENDISFTMSQEYGTIVYVAIDGIFAGCLVISDEIKSDSKKAIEALKQIGVKNIVMLTGDNKIAAKKAADELGITKFYAELLPHEKVEKLEVIFAEKNSKGKVIFVGDGINDAPVLARADIGIAMGGVGSDAAIEAADVVIMTDEISKVASAIKIARKTHKIVWQNIVFALGVKGIILILGAFGLATMWEAVFGDVGVALIAILNAMRVLNLKNA
jgi:Cd2+/Zn2+-exporting ATPase